MFHVRTAKPLANTIGLEMRGHPLPFTLGIHGTRQCSVSARAVDQEWKNMVPALAHFNHMKVGEAFNLSAPQYASL